MSSAWGDFDDIPKHTNKQVRLVRGPQGSSTRERAHSDKQDEKEDCDWGFGSEDTNDDIQNEADSDSSKFIPIYERYLQDKQSIVLKTQNFKTFANDPQKALREWFENEGHEFGMRIDQPGENQFVCKLDLPIGEHDFTITSEIHNKRKDAIDEVCLASCRMLDDCQLLYPWQTSTTSNKEDSDKRKLINEANKEDDIEFDRTISSKRHCNSTTTSAQHSAEPKRASNNVNTYESLMARWNELNMSILRLKAELVKLDLSVSKGGGGNQVKQITIEKSDSVAPNSHGTNMTGELDDEVDPLDEYMSNLETKTRLSMDEKIEKSRLKSQISAYEREQSEVSRLIELAKPTFNLDKACPTAGNVRSRSSTMTKNE